MTKARYLICRPLSAWRSVSWELPSPANGKETRCVAKGQDGSGLKLCSDNSGLNLHAFIFRPNSNNAGWIMIVCSSLRAFRIEVAVFAFPGVLLPPFWAIFRSWCSAFVWKHLSHTGLAWFKTLSMSLSASWLSKPPMLRRNCCKLKTACVNLNSLKSCSYYTTSDYLN